MNKYLLLFPLLLCIACAGIRNRKMDNAVAVECGEHCRSGEMVIGADTILSQVRDVCKRTLKNIKKIRKGMTISELVTIAGPADCDCGCGIHILIYALQDGSCVHIGTNDQKVLFIKRIKAKYLNERPSAGGRRGGPVPADAALPAFTED
jgi:hypothetical protein